MDNKKHYNKGLTQLKEALASLEEAQQSFTSSSNATNDFPTARHEIMEVAEKIAKVKLLLENLHEHAYINRIQ